MLFKNWVSLFGKDNSHTKRIHFSYIKKLFYMLFTNKNNLVSTNAIKKTAYYHHHQQQKSTTVATTLVSHVQAMGPWLSISRQGKSEGRRSGKEERGEGNQCEKRIHSKQWLRTLHREKENAGFNCWFSSPIAKVIQSKNKIQKFQFERAMY